MSTASEGPSSGGRIPFGVPSDTPGGSPGTYRDNRVHYIFGHIDDSSPRAAWAPRSWFAPAIKRTSRPMAANSGRRQDVLRESRAVA